jgi:hypothetical protein
MHTCNQRTARLWRLKLSYQKETQELQKIGCQRVVKTRAQNLIGCQTAHLIQSDH